MLHACTCNACRSECAKSGRNFANLSDFLDILNVPPNEFELLTTNLSSTLTSFTGFCLGSASVPRGYVSQYFAENETCLKDGNEVVFESKGAPPTNCSDSQQRL